MKTKLNKIDSVELNGTSYKGVAIRTTINLLKDALGVNPSIWDKNACEWYLQHGEYKFSLYSTTPLKGDDVAWFRIGTIDKFSSFEVKDIILHMLKAA